MANDALRKELEELVRRYSDAEAEVLGKTTIPPSGLRVLTTRDGDDGRKRHSSNDNCLHVGRRRLRQKVASRDETDDEQRVTSKAIGPRLGQQSTDMQCNGKLTIVPRWCTIYSPTNRASLPHISNTRWRGTLSLIAFHPSQKN